MPYIKQSDRIQFDKRIPPVPSSAGELNYLITTIMREYIGDDVSYSKLNEVVGVIECAKLELYRRLAAPYEDLKIDENGDVY